MERGGAPFRLDGAGQAWVVVDGSVDVYAVPLMEDGTGPRRFLWSAERGDVIVPAPLAAGTRFGLTAIGVGPTRLRAMEPAALTDPAHVPAIDRLVANLTRLVAPADRVAVQEMLDPGQRLALPDGHGAGIREGTVWVRHLAGSTRIGGREWLELDPSSGWVPLHNIWVRASSDSVIETRDTEEHFREGGDLTGLRSLVGLVQADLDCAIDIEDARLTHRLHVKSNSDRRIWQGAIERLASILETEQSGGEVAATLRDPLMASCAAVGAVAGIEFREPPRWETRERDDLLTSICRVSRVRSRRVALRGTWWRGDAGPLVGYLKEDASPVALLPEKGARYVLFNPRTGEKSVVSAAVAAGLQSFAVMFFRPLPDSVRSVRDLLVFAVPLIRSDLAGIAAAALAGALLLLLLPVAVAQVFNRVIPNAQSRDLLVVLIALFAAAIGTACFDVTRAFAMTRVETRLGAALQAALVDRLLALPVPFFRRYAVGDLTQRSSALGAFQEVIGTATPAVLVVSAFSIVNVLVLFYYEWRLALLSLGLAVGAGLVNAVLVHASLRHERRQQDANTRVSGFVFQLIAGIVKLRVSGAEARAFAVWSNAFAKQREAARRAARSKALLNVFNEALPVVCTAALFYGAGWVLFGQSSSLRTGDFVAFNVAFGTLFAATVALSNASMSCVTATAAMEKCAPILETAPEVTETRMDPGALKGLIEGSHLTFRYSPDGPLVLDDVSFRVEPGQFVAFVGPSGSGKSTALRLLLGFESPETGAVYYDGQDLASLDISAIRNRQLGVVLQSSRLLGGDILTNIVGANSSLALDDAWAAAQAAGLADDIRAMPMGMQTLISEGGTSTFSGGQRQRLLIARALVRKPRIILFDEATSALDNITQRTVTRTLELSSATRIVIAHRLSTIRKADRIFVMNRGKIEEQGDFDALVRANGLFSRLIARQQA